ncbi:glycosyl transferase 8 family protein [Basidiobolus meristosporus CBS 931.73]|uniref:Glycosyl transferase 8 family protein n=1 Tax=Basidiobolus meristosporus CBS 931.73 TaxID=1314790 RepID=A0A1Y1YAT8_9FUNG|nr:glycosyl transferase 8 family protein [Basidiobolus meristosporus CBS 931.73]|eukprot:ORX95088.1 glycosyl transferase 8 family protein [Basidiobolus meristosporus CBS 931.73]
MLFSTSYAWVTLLTRDEFLDGVRVLARSLRMVNTMYPLVVIHTSTVSPKCLGTLSREGCITREVEFINPNPGQKVNYLWERYSDTWTKLQVWSLSEFEKVTFLDADMLVLRNMDELFDAVDSSDYQMAAVNACRCNPLELSHYPKHWKPSNCAHTILENSGSIDPKTCNRNDYFNSGLMVLIPSPDLFTKMVAKLRKIPNLNQYLFPDQDFLNDVFQHRWAPLSYVYNALKPMKFCHSRMWDINEIKNIHYILEKPWDVHLQSDKEPGPFDDLYWLWWDVYSQSS